MRDEFPFEAARDLVGILRVLWAEERSHERYSRKKLAVITATAKKLQAAIRLAATHDPGTAPYRKAQHDAEAAAKSLEQIYLVGLSDQMPPFVRAAGLRVVRDWRPWKPTKNQETIMQRVKRG